jgi:hypothetical protein
MRKGHVFSIFPLMSMTEPQQEDAGFASRTRKLVKQDGFAISVALTSTEEHVIHGITHSNNTRTCPKSVLKISLLYVC